MKFQDAYVILLDILIYIYIKSLDYNVYLLKRYNEVNGTYPMYFHLKYNFIKNTIAKLTLKILRIMTYINFCIDKIGVF